MVNRDTVTSSLFWKFLERCTAQIFTIVIGIILARLLAPEDFGALSILLVFVNLSVILTEAGFNTALIQKEDTNEKDYGTVLTISLIIAGILYLLLYVCAPIIAGFYYYPDLDDTMRIIALVLFPNAINSVFTAKISREFRYKTLFYANLSASITSGLIGVALAFCGYGLWALVLQQLTASLMICFVLHFQLKWWPLVCYSAKSAKRLFSFGWKLMAANVVDNLFADIRTLLIGKVFNTNVLGFYTQAKQYPFIISKNINTSIGSVMLPTLSSYKENIDTVKAITRRAIKTSTYLVFPVLLGFAAVSNSFVLFVLTDKWIPSIVLIKILCVMFLFEPQITINSQARNAIGKSGLHLMTVIAGKAADIFFLISSWLIFNTIEAIAIGQVLSSFFSAFLGGAVNKKIIGYKYREQIFDILPNLTISLIMYAIVYWVLAFNLPVAATFITQIIIGGMVYLLLSILLRNENYIYLKEYVKQRIAKNNENS